MNTDQSAEEKYFRIAERISTYLYLSLLFNYALNCYCYLASVTGE